MTDLTHLQPKNIIVRMPNWVGDVVMAIPVLIDLRRFFPDATITAMCRRPMGQLLQEMEEVDEIFTFTKTSRFVRREEKRGILEKLREGKYDLGVILPSSFSSAWWFYQGKVQNCIGFEGAFRRSFLTASLSLPKNVEKQHLTRTYKALLSPLGIPISETAPKITLTEEEKQQVKQLLVRHGVKSHHKIVGVNPGAAYGSAKCWLPERFREVTKRLLEDPDTVVVFFGDLTTAPLVKEICQGLSQRVINMAGLTTLRELVQLIAICDVLLTNDSGPMHIASALGTFVVALFGSTSAIMTGPTGNGKVIQKPVACSPCYRRVCPIDFRCMKQIGVEEVAAVIQGHLHPPSKKLAIVDAGEADGS